MTVRRTLGIGCLLLVACPSAPATEVPPLTTATPSGAVAPKASTPTSREDTVRALQAAALASSGGSDLVLRLTTDVGQRLAGGANDKAAVAWALAAMTRQGLTEVHAEPAKVPHWERGSERAEIAADGKKPAENLVVTALGGSEPTPANGIEAAVVEVESLAALEKIDKDAVRGKIVFVNRKMRRAREGGGYGETVGARYTGPSIARAKGALAFLLRSVGTDEVAAHTGYTAHDDPEKVVPAAAVSGADADKLHRTLEEKKNARVRLTLTPKWFPDVESANVVGDLPGREKNGEIVLIGAHLDSWDLGTGALDDAAGCAIVLEAARAIAALPTRPRRTVRVVLFASEEMGGGSRAYARAHEAEAGKHVLAMEADAGTDKVYAARFLGAVSKRPQFDTVAALLAPLGIVKADGDAFGGADVSPLRKLGVPTMDLEQDFSQYFDLHHTRNDTFEHINKEGLAQAAAAFATVAWWAAEMDGDFGRVPTEKRAGK